MKILVINAGSSSYKLALFDLDHEDPISPLWKGKIDWGRQAHQMILSMESRDFKQQMTIREENRFDALQTLLNSLWMGKTKVIESLQAIERVGHRVVHGGTEFTHPIRLTSDVLKRIQDLASLAPLHNPANLEGIHWMEKVFPCIPHLAVFDTAFHHTMSEVAKTYPLPYEWKETGIQRYGFHGISHQYCAEYVAQLWQGRPFKMINCHLGNGASLCAIENGKSVGTTMGFTPLEGLMMGTRCGSIDPGILLYLWREQHWTVEDLDRILNFESGLKGIGGSSDMRDILHFENEKQRLAFEMYVYRLKGFIGALAAQLDGIDILSFTGGIGENVPQVRAEACSGLKFWGVYLDQQKNMEDEVKGEISSPDSRIKVFVIPTQEEWMIAKECWRWKQ